MSDQKENYQKVSLINQTIKTMMNLYDVKSHKTWNKMLFPIQKNLNKLAGGITNYRKYNPRQVSRIVEFLGDPFKEV